MRKYLLFASFVFMLLFLIQAPLFAITVKDDCVECHVLTEVYPDGHEDIKADSIEKCTECHKRSSLAQTDSYSVRMHTSHINVADCSVCHEWESGESFSVKGSQSFGNPDEETFNVIKNEIMLSWAVEGYMDRIHAKASLSCSGCHGDTLPEFYTKVSNETCLKCHGPIDTLVNKTVGKISKDRNVHKSKHFGIENECIVCHKGHMPSQTLCLDCHKTFDLNPIPAMEKK